MPASTAPRATTGTAPVTASPTPAAENTTLAWLTRTPPWRSTSEPLSKARHAAPAKAMD